MERKSSVVNSTIGQVELDSTGSAVGTARIDPQLTYSEIPALLKDVIDKQSPEAWNKIRTKIDYIYFGVSTALESLDNEISFSREIIKRVNKGQNLLFKPNIVRPECIDKVTHGEGGDLGACTPWPFVAAVMRWFHDKLDITYHQMSLGEAGSHVTGTAHAYTLAQSGKAKVTPCAIMEGKWGDSYGGWGFYFARKYLADTHPSGHKDDPMCGFEESITDLCLSPGEAKNKLMVYDLNMISDDRSNGRDIPVAHGVNYKAVTLHKAVIGGDPGNPEDRQAWPGCVLINLPKIKIHGVDPITNAVKNLGIGLYPMECNVSDEPGKVKWKYSYPDTAISGQKNRLPHFVWMSEDSEPHPDENGVLQVKKTGGVAGTMADVLEAVKDQDIFMLHVIESILAGRSLFGRLADLAPEGLIFAAVDPVAVDQLCFNYLFSTVPMNEARRIKKANNMGADFIQKMPVPKSDGRNIVTGEGFDSLLPRYFTLKYCEKRGLGQREYHVVGRDEWHGGYLASVEGHLGKIEGESFSELITAQTYGGPNLWNWQTTTFAYAQANDSLTGSAYKAALLSELDENKDGVIDLDEKGKHHYTSFMVENGRLRYLDIDPLERLRLKFLLTVMPLRNFKKEWNKNGYDWGKWDLFNSAVGAAIRMSRAPNETPDSLFPGMMWGNGKWPSIQLAERLSLCNQLYGPRFPGGFDIAGLYGCIFQYADQRWNGGRYTKIPSVGNADPINAYHKDLANGSIALSFVLYVPPGHGSKDGKAIPNVHETDDPGLILTASLGNGQEVWRDGSLPAVP